MDKNNPRRRTAGDFSYILLTKILDVIILFLPVIRIKVVDTVPSSSLRARLYRLITVILFIEGKDVISSVDRRTLYMCKRKLALILEQIFNTPPQ